MFGFETIPSNPKLAQNDYQPNGPGSNISISRDLSDIQSTGRPRVGFSSSYILETNAPPELKIISQPMGVALDDKDYLGYYSDSTAGQDTRVYVVEIGAQTNHEVSLIWQTNSSFPPLYCCNPQVSKQPYPLPKIYAMRLNAQKALRIIVIEYY